MPSDQERARVISMVAVRVLGGSVFRVRLYGIAHASRVGLRVGLRLKDKVRVELSVVSVWLRVELRVGLRVGLWIRYVEFSPPCKQYELCRL